MTVGWRKKLSLAVAQSGKADFNTGFQVPLNYTLRAAVCCHQWCGKSYMSFFLLCTLMLILLFN